VPRLDANSKGGFGRTGGSLPDDRRGAPRERKTNATRYDRNRPCLAPAPTSSVARRPNSVSGGPARQEAMNGGNTKTVELPRSPSTVGARSGRPFSIESWNNSGSTRIPSIDCDSLPASREIYRLTCHTSAMGVMQPSELASELAKLSTSSISGSATSRPEGQPEHRVPDWRRMKKECRDPPPNCFVLTLITQSLPAQSAATITDHIVWERDFPNLAVSVTGAAVADRAGNLWAVSDYHWSDRLILYVSDRTEKWS